MTNQDFSQGQDHGTQAFMSGRKRVPAQDSNFTKSLTGRQIGDPRTTQYLDGWLRGWDLANLANDFVLAA